jgi:hypothetical protein
MHAPDRRTLTRLLAGSATAGLLVAATTTGAEASTTSFAHITTATASAALPTTSSLPSGVKLIGKVTVTKSLVDLPCSSAVIKVPLTGSTGVAAIYSSAKSATASPTDSVWTISEAVFSTTAQAEAATVKVVAAQTKCPAVQTEKDGKVTAKLTRTVSALDTSEKALWKGYRTVSHLTTNASADSLRVMDTYFTRGNVLVKVQELAPITPNSEAKQDALRKAVTVATLAKLDAVS